MTEPTTDPGNDEVARELEAERDKPASEPAPTAAENEAPAEVEAPPAAEVETPEQVEPVSAAGEGKATGKAEEEERTHAHGRPGDRPRHRPFDPSLARAYRTRRPVRGKIEKVIKGGYEVRVGKSRGFCPHSQIDLHRVDEPEKLLGETKLFQVTQMRRGGEDVVLSRRAVLEEERAEEAAAVRATLLEGAVMQGKVSGIADFGVFVDLGAGVQGLVHLSEVSHHRLEKVPPEIHVGDVVRVKILKIQPERGRISLSLRQAREDPWQAAAQKYRRGEMHEGTIVRMAEFGAFVEMGDGIEALAPAREFPPASGGWNDGLDVGHKQRWMVLSVDPRARRMSVIPEPAEGEPSLDFKVEPGAELTGKVQRVERFGIFVWLAPGRVGMVPSAWTGTPKGTRLANRFPVGRSLDVEVVEVAEGGRKIRLTCKGVEPVALGDGREKRPHREEIPMSTSDSGSFGTSLGDALKAALGSRNNDKS